MNRYEKIISSMKDTRIGVIGDVVADVYILGYPDRLSREAPVMVVRFEKEQLIPGCAANTMNNLLSLGCKVVPVSLIGETVLGGLAGTAAVPASKCGAWASRAYCLRRSSAGRSTSNLVAAP